MVSGAKKVVSGAEMEVILEYKMHQNSKNIQYFGKSADMRLDRAGSIALHVGPRRFLPKLVKKQLEMRCDFEASFCS